MRVDIADFVPQCPEAPFICQVYVNLKWCLMDRKPLPTWVHQRDAWCSWETRAIRCWYVCPLRSWCHVLTLSLPQPYRGPCSSAQGTAIAVGDTAAVLGALL